MEFVDEIYRSQKEMRTEEARSYVEESHYQKIKQAILYFNCQRITPYVIDYGFLCACAKLNSEDDTYIVNVHNGEMKFSFQFDTKSLIKKFAKRLVRELDDSILNNYSFEEILNI